MEAGKAIEVDLVRTFHERGILLSAGPDEEVQTGFVYEKAWLTGSVDCVTRPIGWNKPLPIEIKTKYQNDINLMKVGGKGPDPAHISQLKVQLALVALEQDLLWPGLDRVTHGYILYLSRDRPVDTAEFRVDLDMKWFEIGVERLKEWKAMFEEGLLPTINPSKKHPLGWRWSYPPCQWCDWKKICQSDHKDGVTALAESMGVRHTQKVRAPKEQPEGYDPNSVYDPDRAARAVLDWWKVVGSQDETETASES
jgi:CRISPR/Cas system-associated exonuclease Cas4 (RecB family)